MKKTIAFVVISVFFASLSFGTESREATGVFAVSGQGANYIGMGGVGTGLANDANAVYWNPAGLMQLEKGTLSFMHAFLYGIKGLSTDFIAYGKEDTGYGAFGLAYYRLGADIDGSKWAESFAALSYARKLMEGNAKIFAGVTLKYFMVDSTFTGFTKGKSRGYGLDIGILAKIIPELSAGVKVRDAYSSLKWDTNTEETNPFNWSAGGSYIPIPRLTIAADLVGDQDVHFKTVHAGGEYWVLDEEKTSPILGYLSNIAGRAGVQVNIATGGFYASAGVGIKAAKFSLDYAFTYGASQLGNTHRISISAKL